LAPVDEKLGLTPMRPTLVGFIVCTLLAASLRFPMLEWMEFKADEVQMHFLATRLWAGEVPLAGLVSSLGVRNPPVAVYIYSLPRLLSSDPMAMAGFSALFGSLAAGVLFLLGARFFGLWVGWIAALLLAVSPWAIILSRKIWAQDLLPFFSVVLVYALLDLWERPNRRAAFAIPIWLALMLQIHFSTAVFVPLVLTALVLRFQRDHLRSWLGGSLVGLLTFAPFLLFLMNVGVVSYFEHVGAGRRTFSDATMFARAFRHFADMADFGSFAFLSESSVPAFLRDPGPVPWTRWLQLPILIVGLIARQPRPDREREASGSSAGLQRR
jgi:4-amino-4-deoxy-L-arabinose transferase-like glycosyltransferase